MSYSVLSPKVPSKWKRFRIVCNRQSGEWHSGRGGISMKYLAIYSLGPGANRLLQFGERSFSVRHEIQNLGLVGKS